MALYTNNDWANFWRDKISTSPIPADTQSKVTNIEWSKYQNEPITDEQHKERIANGIKVLSVL